jgi:hypothetical protein
MHGAGRQVFRDDAARGWRGRPAGRCPQGTSVSTWLTEAAADKLRNELLGAALDQWEAEDGSFTQTELDEAASRLGLAPRSDVA